jgi:hypothetical protein
MAFRTQNSEPQGRGGACISAQIVLVMAQQIAVQHWMLGASFHSIDIRCSPLEVEPHHVGQYG